MDELTRIDIKGWRNALFNEVGLLQNPDHIEYLARKASCMVAEEQHQKGNMDYKAVFSDPDALSQDPGG